MSSGPGQVSPARCKGQPGPAWGGLCWLGVSGQAGLRSGPLLNPHLFIHTCPTMPAPRRRTVSMNFLQLWPSSPQLSPSTTCMLEVDLCCLPWPSPASLTSSFRSPPLSVGSPSMLFIGLASGNTTALSCQPTQLKSSGHLVIQSFFTNFGVSGYHVGLHYLSDILHCLPVCTSHLLP